MHMMISKHHEAGKLVCVIFEQMFLTNIYIVRHHQKYNKSTTINEDNTYPVE